MEATNYFYWLRQRRSGASAMDASPDWDESKVKRTAKGGKGGGQFAKKPETLKREDGRDILNPKAGEVRSPFRDVSAEEYADTIAAAKKDCISPHAWRVDAYPAEHYEDSRARLVTDNGSCVAVQANWDIVSLCKRAGEPIRADAMMAEAVKRGGDRLDSFDGNWALYRKCGFSPIAWTPFNQEYAPEGWAESGAGEEAVVFFAFTGDRRNYSSKEEIEAEMAEWKNATPPCTGETGYDDAMRQRDDFIKNRKK